MLPTIAQVADAHPFAIVVNLGSNDALQARSHPDWRAGFARMLSLVAPQRCVLFTTINARLPGPTDTARIADEINRALVVAAGEHHNFHVIDWNAVVETNGSTLLTADDIHPSPAGQLKLAALIRTALPKECHR